MLKDQGAMNGKRGRLQRSFAIAFVIAMLGTVFLVEAAGAACGGVETAKPRRNVNPGGKAPLAIGDSVMLFAVRSLGRIGYQANARGCRAWDEGLSVMRKYKRDGRLPHLITIALGADWVITKQDIRRALHIAGKKRVLALVTPRESGGGQSTDAANVRWAYRTHSKRVMLLDWVKYARGRRSWFQPDGLHLTFTGAAAYTKLMGKALRFAAAGEFPRGAKFPRW
jgi:hypothetical protein